jgi:hypothetical protein
MLTDTLTLLALILLICAHGVLIRSCYNLHTAIPEQSSQVQTRIDSVHSLLDEALDMIHDFENSAIAKKVAQPLAFESGGGGILSTLLTSMLMPSEHGHSLTKERTIHEDHSPPTLQAENEFD